MIYRFDLIGVYGIFFISAATSGFVQTLVPMMTIEIYREQTWLYEQIIYPVSLIVGSVIACALLQYEASIVYLWCMLTTSIGFAVLAIGKYSRYVAPIQLKCESVLDD